MTKAIKNITFLFLGGMTLFFSSCFKDAVNESLGYLNDETSLFVVRNLYKGTDLVLNDKNLGGAKYTSGIVVSNHENGNFPSGFIAIQDELRGQIRGIILEVPNPLDYHFGDLVSVKIVGAKLNRQNGPLAISGLTKDAVQVITTDNAVVHRPLSVNALKSTPELYEGTLVSITADVKDLVAGSTLAGKHILIDGSGNEIALVTYETANFKDNRIAPNASFNGIFLTSQGVGEVYLQNGDDMTNPSGNIYSGWPESFENPSHPKGSYNMVDIDNNVGLSTGEWHLFYSIIGNTAGRDRIVSGENAIRVQQNLTQSAFIQMNFDVPDGASKVTFWYGSYYTDRSCTFQLEYSTDQGATWVPMGNPVTDAHTTTESINAKQAVYLMDIQVPVRFRINKFGLGTSSPDVSNGRLGIDDFAIYKSY